MFMFRAMPLASNLTRYETSYGSFSISSSSLNDSRLLFATTDLTTRRQDSRMPLQTNARVAVIGSGVSSLAYTYFLSKLRPDLRITVYEQDNRPSGYIYSKKVKFGNNEVLLQKGPRTLRSVSPGTLVILDVMKKLNISDEVKYINSSDVSNKKWLVAEDGNNLIQLPNSFESFSRFLINNTNTLTKIIFSLLKEPFIAKKTDGKEESIHEFFSRRLSPVLTLNFLSAVYRGIYAGDVKKLSVNAVMPGLVKLENDHGSILKAVFAKAVKKKQPELLPSDLKRYGSTFGVEDSEFMDLKKRLKGVPMLAFSKGLASFTVGLHKNLSRNSNITFKINTPVKSIRAADSQMTINGEETVDFIRSSINSNTLMKILGVSKPEFHLNYVDIFMVNVYTLRNDLSINGFGYLVPEAAENKEELLGCIFDSDIEKTSKYLFASNRPPISNEQYTKLTLMFGGSQWSSKQRPSDEVMIQRTRAVLKRHLGVELHEEDIIDTSFIPQCIPQFEKGYLGKKKEFHEWLNSNYNGKIQHGGMSFGEGCGVPDVVMNSFNDAYEASK